MERNVCIITEGSNPRGGQTRVGKLTHLCQSGQVLVRGCFRVYRQREGLHAETSQSALTVIWKLVIGGVSRIS